MNTLCKEQHFLQCDINPISFQENMFTSYECISSNIYSAWCFFRPFKLAQNISAPFKLARHILAPFKLARHISAPLKLALCIGTLHNNLHKTLHNSTVPRFQLPAQFQQESAHASTLGTFLNYHFTY